ncbi:trypsin inhibitor ClTI-1-like isoform X2 [Acanthaster planci]|uniref:Trypsin inhibitor ClTI-1-like isoform X2 n=1 Tax=Acanthaster planci TaxID=133434 RepID=A0A8B7ZBE8_ACAPL|nr:trypsin inhibitor ClTI-1-like isoform X2 [Acanthaster planci]
MRHSSLICIAVLLYGVCEAVSQPGPVLPTFCEGYLALVCPPVLMPVCASTGTTYPNLCVVCSAMRNEELPTTLTYTKGRCATD